MNQLHHGEIVADHAVVRDLLCAQRPDLAELPLDMVGGGTDNTMYRLGDDYVVRLPRTAEHVQALIMEQRWLPRLAGRVPLLIPQPYFAGRPDSTFPLPWAIYKWIDGVDAARTPDIDWSLFGTQLAQFVERLHNLDLMDAARGDNLTWYRGGPPNAVAAEAEQYFLATARLIPDLNVEHLRRRWIEALNVPPSARSNVWLHGDLRPANLLVHRGQLHAVIDFGGLSVGLPDAEHAPVWDLPPAARESYRDVLQLDEATWARARAWAIFVGIAGLSYYWDTWPQFAHECLQRLRAIEHDHG